LCDYQFAVVSNVIPYDRNAVFGHIAMHAKAPLHTDCQFFVFMSTWGCRPTAQAQVETLFVAVSGSIRSEG